MVRRNTPAAAGLTPQSELGQGKGREYPRSCGAYLVLKGMHGNAQGIPPLLRG